MSETSADPVEGWFSPLGIALAVITGIMMILIIILMSYNLKYWKQQALNIQVLGRRLYLRKKRESKKGKRLTGYNTKKREEFEKSIVDQISKEMRPNFCQIYWNTSVKYNHYLTWIISKLKKPK